MPARSPADLSIVIGGEGRNMNAVLNWLFTSRIEEQRALARANAVLDEAQRTRINILIQEGQN